MKTKREKIIILIILLIATALSPLDYFIVNLALTPIQKDLDASGGQLQMIISFYSCAFAVFLITGGRLGDLLGRKQMFMLGLAGFVLSSTLCGFAPNASILILGRVLQGISGAIMIPQVLAMIHVTFTEKEKTTVMALYSFTFGISMVLGQLLGGLLISLDILGLGWRIIFLINLPIGLLALIGAYRMLANPEKDKQATIDVLGIILCSSFLGLFVYPLTRIGEHGWDISVIGCLLVSAVTFIFFVIHQKRVVKAGKSPLIDVNIFKYKNLTIGACVAFLFYSTGIFYLALGIYLQEDQGWNFLHAGIAIMPFGIGFVLSSLVSPVVVRKIGDYVLNLGLALFGLGFAILAISLSLPKPTSIVFYVGLFVAGCGMGTTLSSVARISLFGIAHQYAGLASGVINSSLQIGSAVGVASIGGIFFSQGKTMGYSHAFQSTLLIMLCILAVACIIAFTITKRESMKR